jgi:hypothetical protein
LPLILHVDAGLDDATANVTWSFRSIDPATGELHDDPLIGFLPPNVMPPQGEGNVSFSVELKQGQEIGTQVSNSASITFDLNPPILTNTWVNLIDGEAPESELSTPDLSPMSALVPIAWTASDAGAGIHSIDVYASREGGSFQLVLGGVDGGSAELRLLPGMSYCLYSRARDRAQNYEATPPLPDTCFSIPMNVDSDGDGCSDQSELSTTGPEFGGLRDRRNPWDFYDVTFDRTIDLSDTIAVLNRFGFSPTHPGYDAVFDRYLPLANRPWRPGAAEGTHVGIDIEDAIVNLQSFGHHCLT